MKALVYRGPGRLALEEVELLSGDVIVEVKEVGICGTDLKTFTRGHHLFTPPAILGHECYGEVRESCLSTVKKGDIVVIAPYLECGICWRCNRGIKELCTNKVQLDQGCFAQYVSLSREKAERLLFPAPIDSEVLVLTEPLACVLTATRELQGIKSALIIGGGPIGALFGVYFACAGVEAQIVEISSWRANYLRELGFKVVRKEVLDARYDAVILCADSPELAEEYLPFVTEGGTLLLFAGVKEKAIVSLDAHQIHYREIRVTGSTGYWSHAFSQALKELVNHEKEYLPLITHRFSLDQFAEAFKVLQDRTALKVVLRVSV